MPTLSSLAALAAAVLTMAGVSYAKALTYTLPEETATLRPGPGVEPAQKSLPKVPLG